MHHTQQQWLEIFEQQAQGDLSVDKFCRKNNITQYSFYKNRKKYLGNIKSSACQSPAFAEVIIEKPNLQAVASSGEIKLALGELKLSLPLQIDPHWLAKLMRKLHE